MDKLLLLSYQVAEELQDNGLRSVISKSFHINRKATILEKDISSYHLFNRKNLMSGMRFIEISQNTFNQLAPQYKVKYREKRTIENLKKNYLSFAIIKNNEVIGDLWYAPQVHEDSTKIPHSDLKWLGLTLKKNEVYLTDSYVAPDERKNFVAIALFQNAFRALSDKGIHKAYGYAWEDLPGVLSFYKMMKFQEYKRIKVFRFLFFRKAFPENNPAPGPSK